MSSSSLDRVDSPPPSAFHPGPAPAAGHRDAAPSRSSRHSEGYPSWLPRRPPPPAPASTIGTSTPAPFDPDYFSQDLDLDAELRHLDAQYLAASSPSPDADDDESPIAPNPLLLGGRKPTPRSVRIVNLESPGITEEARVPAAAAVPQQQPGPRPTYATSYAHWNARAKRQNRVSSGSTAVAHPSNAMVADGQRGWARANVPPTMFNSVASSYFPAGTDALEARPRPRFNTRGLHLELLRSPSLWMKIYYRLWPLLVIAHLPLQTFLDFNTAYMLIQVSKYPLPTAGPSSSKNWALGTAAYIACWLAWVLIVFIVYELIYSFARRWRVRRPLIFPIYLSNPGYTYACMTSFNNFCFLQHLRWTAFVPISPELEGITSSTDSSPRSSKDEPDQEQEMVERGQQGHGRTDSTSSSGSSAHEEDPALGRPASIPAPSSAPNIFRKLTFASSTRNRAIISHRSSNSMDIPKTTPKGFLRRKLKRTKRFWSQITWRDGLAETFNLYAQNVPNVAVLLPRAGLALALILGFAPGIGWSASTSLGSAAGQRDSTFFRSSDGLLTAYALGILWTNVAWAVWRACVLLISWLGMWILSGHTCAGICGPRDKWEEEELNRLSASLARARRQGYQFTEGDDKQANETTNDNDTTTGNDGMKQGGNKTLHRRIASWYSNSSSVDDDDDILPWEWRECTRARVQDAWEFCVVGDGGRLRWGAAAAPEKVRPVSIPRPRTPPAKREGGDDGTGLDDAGLQRVLAAVGFPTPGVPTPARRGALRSDLFESPTKPSLERSASPVVVGAVMLGGGRAGDDDDDDDGERKGSLPLLKLPYPFAKPGSGFVSSREGEEGLLVPFPAKERSKGSKEGSRTSKSRSAKSGSANGSSVQEAGGEDGEGDKPRDASSSSHNYSSESSTTSSPSSSAPSLHSRAHAGSQSNSLSSLGHPIPPSSAAFVSRGYPHTRALTQSGATAPSFASAAQSHGAHRHSSIGSAVTAGESSGGFGGGMSAGVDGSSPVSARARTRFPFLSGPTIVSSSAVAPSTHFGVHGRRVAQHHTGGTTTTNYSFSGSGSGMSAQGQGRGHTRGLSHASGFSGLSAGVASDLGYAASGSGEGDLEGEGEGMRSFSLSEESQEVEERRERASLSQSSGESKVIPMPPRHPHAGGRARSGVAGSSSESGLSRKAAGEGIAFPTGSDVDVTHTTAELGMVTGYAKGMGMEMLSIEASDSLARRERAGRMGPAVFAHQIYAVDDVDDGEERVPNPPASEEAPDDHDDMYVQEDREEFEDAVADVEEDDEEAQAEREDRVGLLSLSLSPSAASLHHHSPRGSALGVDQLGQLLSVPVGASSDVSSSRRSSRRNSATAKRSKESLSAATPTAATAAAAVSSRSRHSSYVRSNRPSLVGSAAGTGRRDSLLGVAGAAVRDRASSFGVRVRERAHSLMQSVVGGAGASGIAGRERTTSELGQTGKHRRLASGDASFTGTPASLGPERRKPLARDYGQLQREDAAASEEEAYYSSSHSRSGSGSVVSGENHTFGRPIPFLAAASPQQRDRESLKEEEEEEENVSTVPEPEQQRQEAPRVRTTSMAPSTSSIGEELFYSPASGGTPLQSGLTTPVPTAGVPEGIFHTAQQDQQQQPQREGSLEVPWTQRLLQPPEPRWIGRDRSLSPNGEGSVSMMLSSAAQSFVTAPVDAQSVFTTTTRGSGGTGGDSSENATLTGSWDETRGSGFVGAFLSGTAAAVRGRGGRRGGPLVERVSETDAAAGRMSDGRVV